MLTRSLMILAVVGVTAVEVPRLLSGDTDIEESFVDVAQASTPTQQSDRPGRVTLKADERGHFLATFKLNGKDVDGIVDTGASVIAINESTARRLGFTAARTDFKYPISTANGQTVAAHVVLDRVEIGSIRVKDVDAFVLKDAALSDTLIGLSFLRRLHSYAVADDVLKLER
ncbi:TIGR02281 family clan AA aspartic protease [Ciceribacter sp. L1K23]|uniref:TIGR02281 family clan AA aspartic protease n=1 Tax=Ciceribacter sp. L1K23 TaxID=2820276 RepID=UPI001B82D8DC|nr:TIGR02281 family clan AA aspartic protease [Ciceribacter sp. L1K23]MBR0557457.1 TIGR02281 family clan AA aspartic protease [Ciceribacter sp. L1K23]